MNYGEFGGQYVPQELKEKLNYDGITLTQNNEYGQEVKHYHLHLIPKYKEEVKLPVE